MSHIHQGALLYVGLLATLSIFTVMVWNKWAFTFNDHMTD